MMSSRNIAVSLVSHRHGHLLPMIFADLARYCGDRISVILTLNVPEKLAFDTDVYPFPVKILHNASPQGFAQNHNQALKGVEAEYYCVLNPDVRLESDPFPVLLETLQSPSVGVVAPKIINSERLVEDNARRFPTLSRILTRTLQGKGKQDYTLSKTAFSPDWIAGMFMLFRRAVFEEVGGFDQRYFLYVEDADLCYRLRRKGYSVLWIPAVTVIHDAARASHRHWRYLWWHSTSLLRFFGKYYLGVRV